MDQFQMAITIMAADDRHWGPRNADGRRRAFTGEELDALADFDWPWAGLNDSLATGANALLSRVRLRASTRIEPTRLPSADATVQV